MLGTQMIVKGHDFPNVTLMGIIAADLSLAANDYRAGERTFALLTQASGRAGRGKSAGEVVIQTYQPEHYSIIHAANQDYEGFYEEEILYRKMLSYPPVCHILAVMVSSKVQKEAEDFAGELATLACKSYPKAVIIGPTPAGIQKINDVYRQVFMLKSAEEEILIQCKDVLEKELEMNKGNDVNVMFDFDPIQPY